MERYLYFMEQTDGAFDAAQDAVAYPMSSFKGFSASGTTTTLLLHFHGVLGQDEDAHDVVTLTITDGDQKAVLKTIAEKMAGSHMQPPFIVVADEDNSIFCHSSITAVEITLSA